METKENLQNSDSILVIPAGTVTLEDVATLASKHYQTLDLTKAVWGTEEEYWEVCMGWSHCGPVIGNSGYRDVEVLLRLLETADAETVILPDDVMRRHINRIAANPKIMVAKVGADCRLFSMDGDKIMNRKGTKLVYDPATKND